MKGKAVKKLNLIGLIASDVLFLAVFIVTAFWGGIAHTGSGIPIPDTGFIIPFFIFIVFSVGQIFAVIYNKPEIALGVCAVKFVLFLLAFCILCGYALSSDYMQANRTGSFHDNLTYSVTVIIALAISILSFLYDTAFGILAVIKNRGSRQ